MTAALRSEWAVFGAGAIVLYVGAEVSIGSNLINFLHLGDLPDATHEKAGKLVSVYYWLGAMVGRLAGSVLLARLRAVRLLSVNAFIAAVFAWPSARAPERWRVCGRLCPGPRILQLHHVSEYLYAELERSRASAAATSGLLRVRSWEGRCCRLPRGTLLIRRPVGLHASFLVPMVAYMLICAFAIMAAKARVMPVGDSVGRVTH